MRTLLAGLLAFLPLVQAQDSRLLKSVEPNYAKYDEDLVTDFTTATASVTVTVLATGKPFDYSSSVPLPMAVVMALKDYEFQPQSMVPHGRTAFDTGAYQVKLDLPVRESKNSIRQSESAIRIGPGIAKGNLLRQVRPEYSEFPRHNRIQGIVIFDLVITKEGYATSLRTSAGPFELIASAYDAVTQWQWRPYLMSREPVEVLAEISVNFALQ